MTKLDTNWGKHRVILEWVTATELPNHLLRDVTSVHGFCVDGDDIMMVNLDSRGWDIPGGHIEPGETPLVAFKREAMEEAKISGISRMIGYVMVDNSRDLHYTGKYPMMSVQVFYRMNIEDILPFVYDFEASDRTLIPFDRVSSVHGGWNPVFQAAFDEAVR